MPITTLTLNDPALLRQQCYINGQWRDAESGKTTDVSNPATGAVIGNVPTMGAQETAQAISAANDAWQIGRAHV